MMTSPRNQPIKPKEILVKLTSLPHRGVGTKHIENAAALLKDLLKSLGATAESQAFLCPKTYLPIIWWLVGGIITGLILAGSWPWIGFTLAAVFGLLGLAHFDWRSTPLPLLVPRIETENIIARIDHGKESSSGATSKLILMAHYDSAPISFIYKSPMVAGFHRSLMISIGLMLLAPILIFLEAIGLSWFMFKWLRYALILYFLIQIVLSSIDYFRFGFSSGAADNASGVAVAIATAHHLWRNPLADWEVELVLTSGEEIATIGSLEYFKKFQSDLMQGNVYILNFDNLGSGDIKIITRTGSVTPVNYDNPLSETAIQVRDLNARFSDIETASWHTGDFDSIWFERAGIPSLTLSAQDKNGLIPNLHRPGDTIENVDLSLLPQAVDFALAVFKALQTRTSQVS